MKIYGTIHNAKNNSPIAIVKIKLQVENKEKAAIFTDEHGLYEYETDEDLIGKNLVYTIEKDGFEVKTFKTVLSNDIIQKKFVLREHEILVDRKTPIMYFAFGVLIVILLVFFIYILNPQLDYEPILNDTPDYNLTLNDKFIYQYTVTRSNAFPYNIPLLRNIGYFEWEVLENEEWIYVDIKNGHETENITVVVYTPDSEFSPGSEYEAKISLINKGNVLPPFNNPFLTIPFRISEKKNKKPELDANIILTPNPLIVSKEQFQPILIQVENKNLINGGTLYWSIKDNVTWIKLLVDDKTDRGKLRITDYEGTINKPRFNIDFAELDIEPGETESARITVQSNNDGKVKIYLNVKRLDSDVYEISHIKTEDWYGPKAIKNFIENSANSSTDFDI